MKKSFFQPLNFRGGGAVFEIGGDRRIQGFKVYIRIYLIETIRKTPGDVTFGSDLNFIFLIKVFLLAKK